MIEIIKTIILDFQEITLETGVKRHLEIDAVPGKATIIMGVRRSGKSTYLYQIIQKLLDDGVSRENILFLNFFDDRLHNLEREGLGLITEAYFSIYPEKKNKETIYCFFDEIQMIEGWEPYVNRLLRSEKCEVYLTGSSAQMLSREIATQMRGRAISWELFPFSFKEFLDYQGIKSGGPFSTRKKLILRKTFDEYWEKGGFPEVAGLDHRLRTKIHQEYFQAVLFRDIIERYNISLPRALMDLAYWLIDNAASLYSVNKLHGYLKSLGHKASRPIMADYIEWLEDAYFLFSVRLYDASLKRSKVNPKKIYCIDHSLITSISSGILINAGHLLENLVFLSLRRIYPDVYYYKTKSAQEVDFVVKMKDRSFLLIQVCESIRNDKTRKREVTALVDVMEELDTNKGIIITRNDEEKIIIDGKNIRVIPVWKFLLDLH
jgi:predicted AAA+ superfamily ATPase